MNRMPILEHTSICLTIYNSRIPTREPSNLIKDLPEKPTKTSKAFDESVKIYINQQKEMIV